MTLEAPLPLLRTKLFMPQVHQHLVVRPRLLDRLDAGLSCKLTLISAPAGSGKTTLLGEWASRNGRPTAWLSLDDGDNDPVRFLSYLVAALETVAPTIGASVLSSLRSPQSPPMETLLTALLNDISSAPDPFVLVLDDYHLIDAETVNRAIAFLIENLPAQIHLVIATRQDPPLPLARLRARGQMIELRASELHFALAEATEFLNQMMGLSLTPADIAALEARTEGWIAGLQLAALSLQGNHDASGFVRAFAGNHRYIADYLVDEVLQRQPASARTFLLQTAILDRLHGPLCDAVTGQTNGQAMLESLERGNFFVVALDDQRLWYRYHHLFADVLRAHLQAEQPGQVAILHRRASEWHERYGALPDAIRHALAAGDEERDADLIERALPALRRRRLGVSLLGWLKDLPDDLVRRRPVLSVAYAWALLSAGELDAVEPRLRDAERWLDSPADNMVIVDDEELRQLPGTIAIYRAGLAQIRGDSRATAEFASLALNNIQPGDHLRHGAAAALLGLASWTIGDLAAAQQHYAAGMASLERAGHLSDMITGAVTLASISVAQGRLRDATRVLEQAVQRAAPQEEPRLFGTADLFVSLSELDRERNDLPAALQHLQRAEDLAVGSGVPHDRSRWSVAMARIREADGDLDGALDWLDEAERHSIDDFFPNVRPIAALRARMWVAQGRLDEPLGWARRQGLSMENSLTYLREFEHITLARLLLAQEASNHARGEREAVVDFLGCLLLAADAGGRRGSVIEILLLQGLAHQAHGNRSAALSSLERALIVAEPEGYVRIFIDEGPPMATLLGAADKTSATSAYTRQLAAAFGTPGGGTAMRQALIEPLSERELDVLRMLATDLDGPEIANELMISLNTMRTHTKNIYSKLGVNNRRTAVRRADDLGLLSRPR